MNQFIIIIIIFITATVGLELWRCEQAFCFELSEKERRRLAAKEPKTDEEEEEAVEEDEEEGSRWATEDEEEDWTPTVSSCSLPHETFNCECWENE